MCSLLGVSRAASLTFTHSPGPTSRPFETGLLVFPFLVGSLRREDGCPMTNVGHAGGEGNRGEFRYPLFVRQHVTLLSAAQSIRYGPYGVRSRERANSPVNSFFFSDRWFTPIVRLRRRKVRYPPDRFPKLEVKTRHLSRALKESGSVSVQAIVLSSPD